MADLEQRILTLLRTPEVDPITRLPRADGPPRSPVKTLDLAKELLGPDATAKMVNPTLYTLEKQGHVVKTSSSEGKDPRWSLASNQPAASTDDADSAPASQSTAPAAPPALPDEELKTRLVELVRQSSQPVLTLTLARAIYGPTATRKMVNPALYALERKGLLHKMAEENGTNPKWILGSTASARPTTTAAPSVTPAPAAQSAPVAAGPNRVGAVQLRIVS